MLLKFTFLFFSVQPLISPEGGSVSLGQSFWQTRGLYPGKHRLSQCSVVSNIIWSALGGRLWIWNQVQFSSFEFL